MCVSCTKLTTSENTHRGCFWPLEVPPCHEGQMMLCTKRNSTCSSTDFVLSVSKFHQGKWKWKTFQCHLEFDVRLMSPLKWRWKKSPLRVQVCLTGLISKLLNTQLYLKVFKDFRVGKGEEHNIIYDLISTRRHLDKSAKCHKSFNVKMARGQPEIFFFRQSALWEGRKKLDQLHVCCCFLLLSELLCCVINTLLWSDCCTRCTKSQRIQSNNYYRFYFPGPFRNSALKGKVLQETFF